MYVVTDYKGTLHYRRVFCLSSTIKENTRENRILYDTNGLYS